MFCNFEVGEIHSWHVIITSFLEMAQQSIHNGNSLHFLLDGAK
jgi:hypothetical protein